jgi:lysine 6-dehydrogenase
MYTYLVLGAGIQGTTIAYDMARFGEAHTVYLKDAIGAQAEASAQHINALLSKEGLPPCVVAGVIDVTDTEALKSSMENVDSCLSAVPYRFNPTIARCAVATQTHFNDLGGNTALVQEELSLHEQALAAGISLIPDCGLAPGLGNTLAAYGIEQLDHCEEVQIRCGGLPQHPQPPLDYMIVFSIEGLTNEYFGKAVILRNGNILEIDTFEELETLHIEGLGEVEAFTTSGGSSTCPWTYEGKINTYEYKTIRYPGHHAKFKVLKDLGLLELDPVNVKGQSVVPRDLFHTVAKERLTFEDKRDLVVIQSVCKGTKNGQPSTVSYTILDYYDEATQFNAMSRMTGYPASIVAIMSAKGLNQKGAIPLELAVPGAIFMEELQKRGVQINSEIITGPEEQLA